MPNTQLKVLLIEDNVSIASNIATLFERNGALVDFAYDGAQGCRLALEQYFDCIILDIAMPKMDGLAVCRALRDKADRHIPIIMLTARDTLDDKLAGFNTGADDYLTKPFELQELYARCQVLAGRHKLQREIRQLELGQGDQQLLLHLTTKSVTRGGRDIHLQPIPLVILQTLMEAHPRAVSRSELCSKIWGDEPTDSDALRSHLYQLRKAIDKPFSQPMIKTIHGIGFALALSPSARRES